MVHQYSHVTKCQWTRRGKGDKSHEVCKHAQSNTFGSDCDGKYLSAPDERWCIDELEQYDEQKDYGDSSAISCFTHCPEILTLQKSLYEEIDSQGWKADY